VRHASLADGAAAIDRTRSDSGTHRHEIGREIGRQIVLEAHHDAAGDG
jgi:hypothetical protein